MLTSEDTLKQSDAWEIGKVLSVTRPATGTIHQTRLITAETGRYALRAYRYTEALPIEREHALIRYATAQGIPAVAPLRLPNGDTILRAEGRFYSLFPYAPGYQRRRSELTGTEIAAMGSFLGRLHTALHDYPKSEVKRRTFNADSSATIEAISRLEERLRKISEPRPSDGYALARLAGQRAWLEHNTSESLDALNTLTSQVIHGDYTEANLFFNSGEVSAVIDWDQAYAAPRAWELARVLDYCFRFETERCRQFLRAYRTALPLAPGELDIAVRCYGLMRAHDLWIYEAIYDEGNDRIRAYIGPEGFVSIESQWERVSASIIQSLVTSDTNTAG